MHVCNCIVYFRITDTKSGQATPIKAAKALYDYTRQTDEEISFTEDTRLNVFDTSDPDWTLVERSGDYGFAPSNYIEIIGSTAPREENEAADEDEAKPPMPARPRVTIAETEPEVITRETHDSPVFTPASPSNSQTPAVALAGIIHGKGTPASPVTTRSLASPPPDVILPPRTYQTADSSDDNRPSAPPLPERSSEQTTPNTGHLSPRFPDQQGVLPSPPYNRSLAVGEREMKLGGYHLYNVYEIVSYFGKNKKIPMTLGINLAKGVISISPESSKHGPQLEWTAEKLTHYSIEGKHVFLELVKPGKSYDFHAGAKDTAEEIVAAFGEIAGTARAGGLKEVIEASTAVIGQKKGRMLYDFVAQGDDEVTVADGDDVIVIDDSKSEDWWMVRRIKNDTVGVVPSSYVDIVGIVTPPLSPIEADRARSLAQLNRSEEEVGVASRQNDKSLKGSEVGSPLRLPKRGSSLMQNDNDNARVSQKSKRDGRENKTSASTSSKLNNLQNYLCSRTSLTSALIGSEPDPNETRTWTDRSGSFKVEAQFIGLREGKIHLHKWNGVKIAVPVQKMSIEDLEYVEVVTGLSLEDDKPLSEVRKRSSQRVKERGRGTTGSSRSKTGSAADRPKKEYDWFEFFLQCGVNPQICERYSSAFLRDEMGQENLPDIDANLLRTLGLKEGDILRVMKHLDNKFGRTQLKEKRMVSFANQGDSEGGNSTGGLFSGPGGALRNNTRKSRPVPSAQTSDVVVSKTAEQNSDLDEQKPVPISKTSDNLLDNNVANGFEDNAWELRPARIAAAPSISSASQKPSPPKPEVTGSLADLSLLSPPLQPTPATPNSQSSSTNDTQASSVPKTTQPSGATSSFFDQVARTTSLQPQLLQQPTAMRTGGLATPQAQTSVTQQQPQQMMQPRARPQAPQIQNQTSLISPPPMRSSSAPQNPQQQSAFATPSLQPQLTGIQNGPRLQTQFVLPGQSMQELQQQQQQQRLQQQPSLAPQSTGIQQLQGGIAAQPTGFAQFAPQQQTPSSGYAPYQQQQMTAFTPAVQQHFMNGQQTGSPFADPPRLPFQPQPTGYQAPSYTTTSLMPQQTGINSILPSALQPDKTGINGFAAQGNPTMPPIPPIPQQPTAAPLIPQKTGPAPPVRFGVTGAANKLSPQPTGKRANLSQASKLSVKFSIPFLVSSG